MDQVNSRGHPRPSPKMQKSTWSRRGQGTSCGPSPRKREERTAGTKDFPGGPNGLPTVSGAHFTPLESEPSVHQIAELGSSPFRPAGGPVPGWPPLPAGPDCSAPRPRKKQPGSRSPGAVTDRRSSRARAPRQEVSHGNRPSLAREIRLLSAGHSEGYFRGQFY